MNLAGTMPLALCLAPPEPAHHSLCTHGSTQGSREPCFRELPEISEAESCQGPGAELESEPSQKIHFHVMVGGGLPENVGRLALHPEVLPEGTPTSLAFLRFQNTV